MLNVYELEKRWKRYKIKYILPRILFASFVFIVLVASVSIYTLLDSNSVEKPHIALDNKLEQKQESLKVNTPTKPEEKKEESKQEIVQIQQVVKPEEHSTSNNVQANIQILPETSRNVSEKKKIVMKPSIEFMKTMNQEIVPYYTQTNENMQRESANYAQSSVQLQQKQTPSESTNNQIQQQQEQKSSINIKKGTTQNDIDHVLKRFKKNNNPALSLFVAKKYYDLGDYHNAYNYALITNEINNDIEESWIIFAKALVKLGQKQKAIDTLKQYLQYSNSSKANLLLENILSGKFQ